MFVHIIVGLLGVHQPIGAGLPFSMTRYAGSKTAQTLCDLSYQDNETQYACRLIQQVNKGLSQCQQQIQQHIQGLQDVANKKDRLEARLQRITPFKGTSQPSMYSSHISNAKIQHHLKYTIYNTCYTHY